MRYHYTTPVRSEDCSNRTLSLQPMGYRTQGNRILG